MQSPQPEAKELAMNYYDQSGRIAVAQAQKQVRRDQEWRVAKYIAAAVVAILAIVIALTHR